MGVLGCLLIPRSRRIRRILLLGGQTPSTLHRWRTGTPNMALWRYSFSLDPPEFPMDWSETSCGCWTQLSYPLSACLNPYQVCMWMRRWRRPPPPPLRREQQRQPAEQTPGQELGATESVAVEQCESATQTFTDECVTPPRKTVDELSVGLPELGEGAGEVSLREVSAAELKLMGPSPEKAAGSSSTASPTGSPPGDHTKWSATSLEASPVLAPPVLAAESSGASQVGSPPGRWRQLRHWCRTAGRDGHEVLFPHHSREVRPLPHNARRLPQRRGPGPPVRAT